MDFLTRSLIINPLLIAALVSLIVTPLTIKTRLEIRPS